MNMSQGNLGAARLTGKGKGKGEDRLSAGILIAGLVATAAIGAPYQFVLPNTIKSVVAALFALAALTTFVWRLGRAPAISWSLFLVIPFGLALVALISAAWAPASPAVAEAVRWAVMGVIMAVAANVFRTVEFAWVARGAHLAALIASVLGLMQFWFDFNLFPADAAPAGTFGNRNFLGEFIATVLPFSLWLLIRETNLKRAIWWGISLGVILLALLATAERSALIATGVLTALTLVFVLALRLRGGVSMRSLLSGVAIALAVVLAFGWIPSTNANIIKENADGSRGLTPLDRSAKRFGSLFNDSTYVETSSFGVRRTVWNAGIKMFVANPLLGVGAGAWNTNVPLYLPETIQSEHVWFAHNEPLQVIVEYGLAGFAAVLAIACLVLAAMTSALRSLVQKTDVDRAPDCWAAAFSVAMFGIVGLSGLPLHAAATCYILALCLGLVVALRPARRFEFSGERAQPWLATARVAAVAALVVGAIVSIQGIRSDIYVEDGFAALQLVMEDKSLPKETADNIRIQGVNDLRRGLDIYADHDNTLVGLTSTLIELQDPTSVLWLTNMMLDTRPHIVSLRCNQARAYSDLGNFTASRNVLDFIQKTRPKAPCLELSEFILAFKQGQFANALAIGQKMIAAGPDKKTITTPGKEADQVARYVVQTSYRAAIRVPDYNAAVDILRVRAERWPELRAGSSMMAGMLLASRLPPDQVSPEALAAFRRFLAEGTAQERATGLPRIPEIYRRQLQ